MKESTGYTVTLNIVITFIIIVFTFLSAALIYFKSNKVSNVITETIEKYEGYNDYARNEIQEKLTSLGYNRKPVNCDKYYNKIDSSLQVIDSDNLDQLDDGLGKGHCYNTNLTDGSDGYCVFICREMYDAEYYYYYKISTNLMFNVPLINELLDIPIFSNTNRLYDFECQESNLNNCK